MNVWESFKTASKGSLAVAREAMSRALASPFMTQEMEMPGMKMMRMPAAMRPPMGGMMLGRHHMLMMPARPCQKHTPMHRLERGRHGARSWHK